MLWLYKIQQRISITAKEGMALLTIIGLFSVGMTVRYVQQHSQAPLPKLKMQSLAPSASVPAIAPPPSVASSPTDTTSQVATNAADSSAVLQGVNNTLQPDTTSKTPIGDELVSRAPKSEVGTEKKPRSEKKTLPTGRVNINTATQAQLEQLPGVGPSTAEKIIAYRQEHGRFSRPESIQEVKGIGPKKYEKMAAFIGI